MTISPLFNQFKSRLASRQARRQIRHLWVAFIGSVLLVLIYFTAEYMNALGWVTHVFPQTVAWCLLAYGISAHLLYRSIHIPAAEQRTLVLIHTLFPYLALILFFALKHQTYSRGAVLLAATLTTLWFWISKRISEKQEKLLLLFLNSDITEELHAELAKQSYLLTRHIELIHCAAPNDVLSDCDGALVSDVRALTEQQKSLLAQIKKRHIRLYSVAAIAESLTGRKSSQELRNPLWQPDGNPVYDTVKRLVDLGIVIMTAPGWIFLGFLVAIFIKIDSNGPILFQQTRTGLHGHPFRIWKFRTMISHPDAPAQFAQANDKRITRLGYFLRKSRLDEIPQLVNVLLGHMSLIGPRPEQHSFVDDFATTIPSYPYRHLVRPGITGWAQVMQGYAASQEETEVKLSYDLYYVSHYSLALDLLIVTKTIRTVLTGFGAR